MCIYIVYIYPREREHFYSFPSGIYPPLILLYDSAALCQRDTPGFMPHAKRPTVREGERY